MHGLCVPSPCRAVKVFRTCGLRPHAGPAGVLGAEQRDGKSPRPSLCHLSSPGIELDQVPALLLGILGKVTQPLSALNSSPVEGGPTLCREAVRSGAGGAEPATTPGAQRQQPPFRPWGLSAPRLSSSLVVRLAPALLGLMALGVTLQVTWVEVLCKVALSARRPCCGSHTPGRISGSLGASREAWPPSTLIKAP